MKKICTILLMLLVAISFFSCASAPKAEVVEEEENPITKSNVKMPDTLDYKGQAYGMSIPDWVMQRPVEMEEMDRYAEKYVFKVESPRSGSQQGAEMYAENMQAFAEVAKLINNRVQSKFSGATVGDRDSVETYMEQVTKSLADAQVSGLRKEDSFWVYRRYYDADGEVEEEAFTVLLLYTIDRGVLDELITSAIEGTTPDTEEGTRAKDLVKGELSEGL